MMMTILPTRNNHVGELCATPQLLLLMLLLASTTLVLVDSFASTSTGHDANTIIAVTPTTTRLSIQHRRSSCSSSKSTRLFLSERVPSDSKSTLDDLAKKNQNSDDDDVDHQSVPSSSFAQSGVGGAIQRLGDIDRPTVWTEFSRLAQEVDMVANLGQGFPDWLPPQFAIDSLVEAATGAGMSNGSSPHQYTRPAGHPNLVEQLSRRYSMHLKHRTVDPMAEIAVTVGASQALYLTLQALVRDGDEVILFEPFFDLYFNQVKLAGGIPVAVPLEFRPYDMNDRDSAGEWILNPDRLREKVTTRTKAIILNSPHNPTGKIFTRTEMEYIAEALELANPECMVLSDEVYKYIVHSPPTEQDSNDESLFCRGHVHFASLPGMWDRTITISSAGKTFSATGWQIGWCIGPRKWISKIHKLLPYVQFCASTVMQEALARSLQKADEPYEGHASYYDFLRAMYIAKRDKISSALTAAGFAVPDWSRTAGGGFFIFARLGSNIEQLVPKEMINVPNAAAPGGVARQDWALCQWLAEEHGILCIPSSPFFTVESAASGASDRFVRVAFCKTDATIGAAATALSALLTETAGAAK
jgi:kynurenine---oxoglutarate transaminase / cysteine-S-conjugate beta-lyase / glutamine---phenylpyruvate transaminase